MWFFILIILVGIGMYVVRREREYREQKTVLEVVPSGFREGSSITPLPDVDVSMYQKRYSLMNNSESSFYRLALKSLPENFSIFPKMRIADIIKTKSGHGYYTQRNKILPKHVDFVVCDQHFRPVCAIEIDGKSHNDQKTRDRDELVEYIFESVRIPLERVRVGENFEDICREMGIYLLNCKKNL